jgi:DNA-binding beta-propeller fold protein YncE
MNRARRHIAIAVLLLAACGPAATPSTGASTSPTTAAATTAAAPTVAAPVKLAKIGTIDLPTQTESFDFATIDPRTKTLYLADRTNKGVDIISLTNEKYVSTITGFIGLRKGDDSGPNGVLIIPDVNQLWATDGDSTVKIIDLATKAIVATIPLGGKKRGDDLSYDPQDKVVVIGSDSEDIPYLSFISVADRKILGTLQYPGAGGIEGIIWSPTKSAFYVSIPSTKANPGGQIDLVDPKAMKVTQTFPLKDCYPHGIAFGPSQRIVVGCSGDAIAAGLKAQTLVIDASTGSVVASISEAGGADIVAYNSGANQYVIAESNMTADGTKAGAAAPQLGVIDAATNKFLQSFPTAKSAHTVTVDPATNHIYVPVPGKGIAVFGPGS